MKILVLMGSSRKGNTYKVAKIIEDEMKKNGHVDFEYLFLNKLNLNLCSSCHRCFLEGEEQCINSDLIKNIERKMEEADGLILASPVYSMQVSAAMKNFLDHIAYLFHRPRFFNKKAMAIVTTAGGGLKSTLKYLAKIPRYWGYNYCYRFGVTTFAVNYQVSAKVQKKGQILANKFYHDIKSGNYHAPSINDIIYFNVWKALNISETNQDSADLKYWTEMGLIEKSYYSDAKLNSLKKGISSLFQAIIVWRFKQ